MNRTGSILSLCPFASYANSRERSIPSALSKSQEWPTCPPVPPVGLYFKYYLADDFLHEWLIRQEEFAFKEITRNEYFEWKLGWPATCDDRGKHDPTKKWRKV